MAPAPTPPPAAGATPPRRAARPVRALLLGSVVLALAAGCASSTESGGARLGQADSWSSVTGGAPNPRRAHSSVADSPELVWSRPLGAPATGVASSDGIGTFFQATVSERGCNLWALTAEDGRKRWCLRMPTDGPRITATVDGRGSVFVPMYGGVGAVSAEGENRWFAETRGIPTTVTLLDNRNLLLVSHLGIARVVNTQTGLDASPRLPVAGELAPSAPGFGLPWCDSGERGCPAPGPAAVDTASGTAYLTGRPRTRPAPELVAVRLTTGDTGLLEVLWRTGLPAGRLGVPVVLSDDRGEVYVHAEDGTLTSYSTADGAARWSAPIGYRPDTPPALLPDGTLVTGGRTSTVWRGVDDDHAADAGPAPVVAVRGADGTGREVWRRDDLRQLTNPAATADGRVVVAVRTAGAGDAPGIALQLLDGGDGRTLHEIPVPAATGPVSGVSVDDDGRIALTTAVGAVYVFA
ncbi:PQQ-binding-like beta-propeller repeat protein [uncultured Dietzia sp.]|uniref:outer membrane protein assembly factor BamB family protein n=1 Tax=uncultured Dietzia sp. TaxID=395519 RepID=UPI0026173BBD|nr:PQQ-binding-like beta-propeller repeat protein [uncultured Dietzia sp.]